MPRKSITTAAVDLKSPAAIALGCGEKWGRRLLFHFAGSG
jgi:hypothetical protein